MLMQAVNELFVRMTLTSVSPLLVREGRLTEEKRKDWSGDKKEIKMRMPHAIPISRAPETDVMHAITNPDPLAAAGRLPFFIPGTSMRGRGGRTWNGFFGRSIRRRRRASAIRWTTTRMRKWRRLTGRVRPC